MNTTLFDPVPQSSLDPSVKRRVQHNSGPFFVVKDGKVSRFWIYVELQDGTVVAEYTDNGERKELPGVTPMTLDLGITSGMWVELP